MRQLEIYDGKPMNLDRLYLHDYMEISRISVEALEKQVLVD
ncbi:hypothetical protein [Petrocella atlantisensis]|nr:hypothetical protein [Petrocella atlantisensis]